MIDLCAKHRHRLAAEGLLCLLFMMLSSSSVGAQSQAAVEPGVAVYRRAYPALVKIEVEKGNAVPSRGSGFICAPDGQILTNYHVVRRASRIKVLHLKYDQLYEADVIAVDTRRDIALLQVRGFAGFQEKNGRKDPQGAPLPFRTGNPLEDGAKVFAVTNPVNLLGIITEGLAQKSSIHVTIRQRGGENYEVLIFSAQVTHGSSGGPVLDAAGKVVGITTGAAGVQSGRSFSAFAVPSRYLAELTMASRSLGASAPAQFNWTRSEQDLPNDGYYTSPLLAENQQPPETQIVSGIVYNEASLPVQGALVHAASQHPELQLHAEPVETTESGFYQMVLPRLPGGRWAMTFRHLAYQEESIKLDELPATPLDRQIRLRDDLVQDAPVFQAWPPTVVLRRSQEIVELRSYVRSRKGVQNRTLDWKPNPKLTPPDWVEVVPRNGGRVTGKSQVTLRYVGTGSEPPGELGQVGFLSGNQDSGEEFALDVYANTPPDSSPLWISGYVVVVSGGAPRENIVVQAYMGETLIRETQTDNVGFFRLYLPSKYRDQVVRLKIEGQRWKSAVSPGALDIKLEEGENERIIQVVAK